jgi:membrane protease YdiL (CAAX protease family)
MTARQPALPALRAAATPALCGAAYALGSAHGPWPIASALLLGALFYGAAAAKRDVATACFIAAGVLVFVMALGVIPGFQRLPLGPVSVNTGKALAGIGAALMWPSPWRWNGRCTAIALLTLSAVPLVAWAIGFVHWSPASPQRLMLFAAANLFTVIAEEWFFRRWLQQPLAAGIGNPLALVVSAALFGLAHFSGGHAFMALAALAGLGYGAVYWAAGGSIWASVALHWVLNVLRTGLFGI